VKEEIYDEWAISVKEDKFECRGDNFFPIVGKPIQHGR
jgi:hypothetical protein